MKSKKWLAIIIVSCMAFFLLLTQTPFITEFDFSAPMSREKIIFLICGVLSFIGFGASIVCYFYFHKHMDPYQESSDETTKN